VATSLTFDRFFAFFGLRENPFHVSPDPRFYYPSPGHDKAFTELLYSIETRQGITVLTGEAGTGKTTLVNRLLDWLHERNFSSAYVFHSLLRPSDLFDFIARDFGIPSASSEKGALIEALHKWLVRRHAAGDIPVVIIDEAQALSSHTLDELRLLLNLETSGGKLIHIVLAGQPELDRKLQRHQLRQLSQRIMFRCRLPLLNVAQTSSYIATRLSAAGLAEGTLFPEETVRVLHGYAHGIPRVINLLCEHALLNAYSDQHRRITPSDIHCVAAKFDLTHDRIPVEDDYPMTTRMALFLSPDPSPAAAAASMPLDTPQMDTPRMNPLQMDSPQTAEILPIFPVPAPVLQTTETILSLNPQVAGTPDPGLPPMGDPTPDPSPVSDPPPTEDPQTAPIQDPNPPVENVVAMATISPDSLFAATPVPAESGSRSAAAPVGDAVSEVAAASDPQTTEDPQSAPMQEANQPVENAVAMAAAAAPSPVEPMLAAESDSPPAATPKRLAFAPKRLATPMEILAAVPNHVAAARRHPVFGPTRAAFRSKQMPAAPHPAAVSPKPVMPAADMSTPVMPTRPDGVSTSRRETPASNRLASVAKSLTAVFNRIVSEGKQLAAASKRIVPPQFVGSISRYCRGVADSFKRDLRHWLEASRSTRGASPRSSAAAGPSARPVGSKKAVVSISKWLREPMAPSLQDNVNPRSANKSRASRPANRAARRSSRKSS
jgi:general secretion pathway protein A